MIVIRASTFVGARTDKTANKKPHIMWFEFSINKMDGLIKGLKGPICHVHQITL